MAYSRVNWKETPDTTTPINAYNLNQMDRGIYDNASNIADLGDEIEKQRVRLNELARLPQGSTSGDAELADIRVAWDGDVYDNAGESVRTQFSNTYTEIDRVRSVADRALITGQKTAIKVDVVTEREAIDRAMIKSIVGDFYTEDVEGHYEGNVTQVPSGAFPFAQITQWGGYSRKYGDQLIDGKVDEFISSKASGKQYGVCVDFEGLTFTRIGDAVGLSAGSDFDNNLAFGGRRRCNVLDDGTITAFYGDINYKEDGTNGQVMILQPRFYYKVEPLKTTPITNGKGYHLRKANYYISDVKHEGYKLHPAFIRNGKTVPYILLSAYEGSTYDVSANSYNKTDTQNVDWTNDLLSSIAGAKPTSGLTQSGATRNGFRNIAAKRGTGWSQATIQSTTATELLFLVEYASFNMQEQIGIGVTNKTDDGNTNMAEITGATTRLGNKTGTVVNTNGWIVVSYRGEENPFGNIWKWVDGINIYNYGEGTVHIADHDFADNKKDGAYQDAGITISGSNGFISSFAYSEGFDWLFIPSECNGTNSLPVGDYFYQNKSSNQYTAALLGGSSYNGSHAGGFYWNLNFDNSYRYRAISGRLLYVPYDTDAIYDYDGDKHYPVPQAIQDLPDYGIGIYEMTNAVFIQASKDSPFKDKTYVRWVGSYKAQITTVGTSAGGLGWFDIPNIAFSSNILCNITDRVINWSGWAENTTCIANENGIMRLYAPAGTYNLVIYYPLATPEIYDISDIIPDDLGIIEVEGGGSVTDHYPAMDEGYIVDTDTNILFQIKA